MRRRARVVVEWLAVFGVIGSRYMRLWLGPPVGQRAHAKLRRQVEREELEREAWEEAVRLNVLCRTCWCGAPVSGSGVTRLCVTHEAMWRADA